MATKSERSTHRRWNQWFSVLGILKLRRLVTLLAELVSESGIRERPPEKPGAISFAGTLGIAQFMPKTAISRPASSPHARLAS